jgi:hypothetical protein
LVLAVAGCGSLLDVSNPNNVNGEDILKPVASAALANGAWEAVAQASPALETVTGTIADEFDWSGSRDAWNELDHGNLHNPYNEFTDGIFPTVSQARWLTDEAVQVLEANVAAALITADSSLAKAYLAKAIIRTAIADQFEDFALSSRDTAAAPVGKANMYTFYDDAVAAADKGLAIAGISAATKFRLTAIKARAQHAKAVWTQVHTNPIPLGAVAVSDAATTAAAAIALAPAADYKFQFTYSASNCSVTSQDYCQDMAGWVNNRQEMRIGKAYAAPDPTGKPTWTTTTITDPITTAIDPVIDAAQKAFKGGANSVPFTVTTVREMRLIIAENALAGGDTTTFATQINTIRALDGLTAWNRAAPQVPAVRILEHERRVNLFLMGRRLLDHYRFGPTTYPSDWLPSSTAVTSPGTLLPITAVECLSNPNIGADNCGR